MTDINTNETADASQNRDVLHWQTVAMKLSHEVQFQAEKLREITLLVEHALAFPSALHDQSFTATLRNAIR